MTTIEKAIERSVTHNETVTVDADADDLAELLGACDDSCDVRDQYGWVEAWGTTDDGDEWRVHGRTGPRY